MIGVNDPKSHQQSKDTARGADGFGVRAHSKKMSVGDGNCHQGRAHDAEYVALDESSRSPVAFQVRTDKPKSEHVKEYVAKTRMQQRVSDDLPPPALLHPRARDQRQPLLHQKDQVMVEPV